MFFLLSFFSSFWGGGREWGKWQLSMTRFSVIPIYVVRPELRTHWPRPHWWILSQPPLSWHLRSLTLWSVGCHWTLEKTWRLGNSKPRWRASWEPLPAEQKAVPAEFIFILRATITFTVSTLFVPRLFRVMSHNEERKGTRMFFKDCKDAEERQWILHLGYYAELRSLPWSACSFTVWVLTWTRSQEKRRGLNTLHVK